MIEATNANNDAAAWHAISDGDVVKRLTTDSEKGLDSAEASARLQKYGPNRLPEGKKRGPFSGFSLSLTTSWFTSFSAPASPS